MIFKKLSNPMGYGAVLKKTCLCLAIILTVAMTFLPLLQPQPVEAYSDTGFITMALITMSWSWPRIRIHISIASNSENGIQSPFSSDFIGVLADKSLPA